MSLRCPADVAEIELLHAEWIARERAGRAAEVLELCAPGVMWMPPDLPPLAGRERIRAWLDGPAPRIRDVRTGNRRIRVTAELAYLVADYRLEYLPPRAPRAGVSRGTRLWVLQRAAAGRWQVVHFAWSVWRAGAEHSSDLIPTDSTTTG